MTVSDLWTLLTSPLSSICRTGQGKTLAFVLPIVERLLTNNALERNQRGRTPRVIVLAPTRELAKQASHYFPFLQS